MLRRARSLPRNPHLRSLAAASLGSLPPLGRSSMSVGGAAADLDAHLAATIGWLCRAQDATPDGGVSGYFDLWTGRWSASYPETTGYIIPSLLACAEAGLGGGLRERAVRMAHWSSDMQMEDGAVLSGVLGTRRGPAVFNTGQVVFGWIAAHQATGDERFADSARRACDWLLANQDPDGAWRRNLSTMTSAPVHTYNGRCGWALAYAGRALGESRYVQAALRASDWVLTRQNAHGWFADNGFASGETPLLHTIAYVIEGLVGVFAFTGEKRLIAAARRALDPVLELHARGRLAGRLGADWSPAVRWRCPTGDAQVAVLAQRLARITGEERYATAGGRLVAEVSTMQRRLLGGRSPVGPERPSAGGVPGSYPVWGEYMRFRLPNWAAKFHLDALLLHRHGRDEFGFPSAAPVGGTEAR